MVVELFATGLTLRFCVSSQGIETGNMFVRNIGIRTKIASKFDRQVIAQKISSYLATATLIPDNGSNGVETDNTPATFWVTNPANTWTDNIATGSESFGFWFELLKRGPRRNDAPYAHLDPKRDNVVKFSGNEFHSIGVTALKYYLNGYHSDTLQLFENLKFSRNKFIALGIFFTKHIHCKNCFFQVTTNTNII